MNDFKNKYKVEVTNKIREVQKDVRVDETLSNREKMLQLRTLDKVIDRIQEDDER